MGSAILFLEGIPMCGIVGYIGPRDATPIILNGLKKLEYRGYDSAGLAVLQNYQIEVRRDAGKLSRLSALVDEMPVSGNLGIGHTRWATHGAPSARNAHPHLGMTGEVVVVHNGIVENFLELRDELQSEGVVFNSDTDTEVIVHLVERYLVSSPSLVKAAQQAFHRLTGAHGIVLFTTREPDKIITARIGNAGGVVVGLGDGETFIASDLPAILEYTRKMVFLESRQLGIVTRNGLEIQSLEGKPQTFQVNHIAWDPVAAEKGEYRHFMHKEIHEQVRSLTDTIAGRITTGNGSGVVGSTLPLGSTLPQIPVIRLPELHLTLDFARRIRKIVITACGTAAHAGMVGKFLIEHLARIPVEVDIASEFRYRDPIIEPDTVVLAISQSGETADTLAALEEARKKGAVLWTIVNAIGSQAMRIADGYISMQSGPEIGVASTKAYTAPLVDLYMLAIYLADLRGLLDKPARRKLIADLRRIPDLVGCCLDREAEAEKVARILVNVSHCLYLGRGINMPTAYEGALKLKEISYIHAEGYPAGEMKHGPIALIDRTMPVVVIAPRDPWYEKMFSQVEQAKARGGVVIAISTDGDELISLKSDHILWVPETPWMLSPVVTVIPLQLLAYHIAALRGLDVDQPRNLAKSVTVE
jgi:glucosamine--fructose-6-phosphate aminotransferase (isomerizing)